MAHNTQFVTPGRQDLATNPQLKQDEVVGAIPFLNPTRARFNMTPEQIVNLQSGGDISKPSAESASTVPLADAQLEWRSRDNRKGRHILIVPRTHTAKDTPQLTTTWSAVLRGILRMCTIAWWDVSWWIGMLFSVGSAIFVACGFIYWLPVADPITAFPGDSLAGGLTAFIGATLFQLGAVLLIVESVNENQTGCFGWALEQIFSHDSDTDDPASKKAGKTGLRPTQDHCAHHHAHGLHHSTHLQHPASNRKWEWWPTWHELTSHYFREIGFLASFTLSIGATVFYVSGIMAIPQIYDNISTPVLYGTYWLAYLVGGILFVVSSALYMLETQEKWWKPAPALLGWWIGLFNMIGSVGWTLSAAFGYCTPHWCSYQSDLSLIWASLAFLFGSMLLWYEASNKYVVERASK